MKTPKKLNLLSTGNYTMLIFPIAMRIRRFLIISVLLAVVVAALCVYTCNEIIEKRAKNKLYSSVQDIPYNKVGLLLGTAKYLSNGAVNPYYTYRIAAAVQLIKAGKIKYVIVSGDNSRKDYNEPAIMKADLVTAGIDSTIIFPDYAGFRTFDSMVRLKEVFSQDSVTVISQAFHNERALYIASREGITAIGFNAKDVSATTGFWVQMREKLARVKVFIDYLTGKKPAYLGEKVQIP